MLKKFLFVLIPIFLLIGYCNLPLSIQHYYEINMGDEFIHNIQAYQDTAKKLPETYDWKLINRLMPLEMDREFGPQYQKLDSHIFEIVYPIGFDGPYLRFCSVCDKWKNGFSCH